jgi:hypothetical protein
MTTSPDVTVISLAKRPRPRVPLGDDRNDASAVLNQVLERTTALCRDLQAIANRHADEAAASSEHVLVLTGAIAGTVLDWIEGWPS